MIEATLRHEIDVNSQVVEDMYGAAVAGQSISVPPKTPNQPREYTERERYLDEARMYGKGLHPLLCDDCLCMIPAIANLSPQSSEIEQQLSFEVLVHSAMNKCPGCIMHLRYLLTHYEVDQLEKNAVHRSIVTHDKGRDGGLGDISAVQDLFDEGGNSNRSLRFEAEGAGLDDQTPEDVQRRLAQRQRIGSSTLWDFQTLLVKYRLGETNVQTCKFVVYAHKGETL